MMMNCMDCSVNLNSEFQIVPYIYEMKKPVSHVARCTEEAWTDRDEQDERKLFFGPLIVVVFKLS